MWQRVKISMENEFFDAKKCINFIMMSLMLMLTNSLISQAWWFLNKLFFYFRFSRCLNGNIWIRAERETLVWCMKLSDTYNHTLTAWRRAQRGVFMGAVTPVIIREIYKHFNLWTINTSLTAVTEMSRVSGDDYQGIMI